MIPIIQPAAALPVPPTQEKKVSELELETLNAVKYELHPDTHEIIETAVGKCYPTEVQKMVAENLLRLLNAQIAHDGSWRMVWRDPSPQPTWDNSMAMFRSRMPATLQCQYLDKDGDIWTVVNIEEGVHDILEIGVTHWVEQCEQAYQFVYNLRHNVLELREGVDTIKRAKGEKATPITDGYELPATKL